MPSQYALLPSATTSPFNDNILPIRTRALRDHFPSLPSKEEGGCGGVRWGGRPLPEASFPLPPGPSFPLPLPSAFPLPASLPPGLGGHSTRSAFPPLPRSHCSLAPRSPLCLSRSLLGRSISPLNPLYSASFLPGVYVCVSVCVCMCVYLSL